MAQSLYYVKIRDLKQKNRSYDVVGNFDQEEDALKVRNKLISGSAGAFSHFYDVWVDSIRPRAKKKAA